MEDHYVDTTLLDFFYFRFGRKPVLFGSITMLSVFCIALAFAPSWPVLTVLFFMMGLGQITSYIVVFVLGMGFFIFTMLGPMTFNLFSIGCVLCCCCCVVVLDTIISIQ